MDNLNGQMFAGASTGVNIKAIIGVAALSPFYFIGFDVIPQAAEEINVPAKKIGKILILSVVLLFRLVLRFGIDVDAKRLMADDFHRALVTIAWIIVKIVGQHASVLDFACTQ